MAQPAPKTPSGDLSGHVKNTETVIISTGGVSPQGDPTGAAADNQPKTK